MSSIFCDVGKLVHKYFEYNLKLVTHCSVQLSVPEEFATASRNSPQLEKLTYRDLWLARGDGLKLSVQLSLDDLIVSDIDKLSLVEGLGLALRDAEIWAQLCLQASLTLPAAGDRVTSSAADIVLSLTYSQDSSKGPRYDSRAQPPAGIAQGGLHSVNVSFCLSEISTGRLKGKKRLGLQETEIHRVDAGSLPLNDYGLMNEVRLCMSQPTLGPVQIFDTALEEHRPASQPMYLSDENLHGEPYSPERGTDSFPNVLSNSGKATDPASDSVCVQSTARKRRADNELLNAGLGLHELVEITDIALRTLISDNRKPNPACIKCVSKSVGPKLSDIAPALFSPGYHDAVSQRSHFLPPISHVFSCMQQRTTSTALREKLDRIARLPAAVPINEDQALEPVNPVCAISSQVEARLWSMLQRTLFDQRAARKLEPVTMPHIGSSFEPTLSEGMLEDLVSSSHETEPRSWTGVEDDILPYSDSVYGEDELLYSDAADTAESVDGDDLLEDYEDDEDATRRLEIESAEPLYDAGDINRQIGRVDSIFDRDMAVVHHFDSGSCNTFEGGEGDREMERRVVGDRNEAPSKTESRLRPPHGSTPDQDEMMV